MRHREGISKKDVVRGSCPPHSYGRRVSLVLHDLERWHYNRLRGLISEIGKHLAGGGNNEVINQATTRIKLIRISNRVRSCA